MTKDDDIPLVCLEGITPPRPPGSSFEKFDPGRADIWE
jgi:hypothetical protein